MLVFGCFEEECFYLVFFDHFHDECCAFDGHAEREPVRGFCFEQADEFGLHPVVVVGAVGGVVVVVDGGEVVGVVAVHRVPRWMKVAPRKTRMWSRMIMSAMPVALFWSTIPWRMRKVTRSVCAPGLLWLM